MASRAPSFIVGIGASAGGIEALEGLFHPMPADTGMAFILVTHLARGVPSALPEILARYTPMPVLSATDGASVEADHVYVCPADHILMVAGGRMHLHARASEIQRKPIDVFLSSLSEERGESAIGILLSGGGSDGTLGLKAIKERGGLTVAQGADGSAPIQASMPDTAIAAGVVDLVLPIEHVAERLLGIIGDQAPLDEAAGAQAEAAADVAASRDAICQILLNQVGHDFRGYKDKTFMRRVRRRMQVMQINQADAYVARLREDPDEVSSLFKDLLIGVTNFFRDPDAFESLGQTIIPQLFEGKGVSDTVRIWVPGCATGEEVYSIAILVREHMQTLRAPPKIQIFATDIDEAALVVARVGRYPAPLLDNVSPQRLKHFFTGDDVSYAVNKDIRDLCIFSAHSVIRDPPFSRIDLISCRNLLIYFGVNVQTHVLPVFHFALKPRGYLFLGTSETVSQHADLFSPMDKKNRIFRRRDQVIPPLQFPFFQRTGRTAAHAGEPLHDSGAIAANLRRTTEARVMEQFAPAHVVVNREGDILHYSARTGKYLEPAAGLPNRQLLAMARRGLRLDLRAALREAMEGRRPAARHSVPVEVGDRVQFVDIMVDPVGGTESDPLFMVVFADIGAPRSLSDAELDSNAAGSDKSMERLEHELRDTRERLQSTIEEYETAVEELKSSNEELQSMNEELQSTNEELETSKEELQSVNEELQTVNSELNVKVEELDRAHNDLRNVFDSTPVATIFLDRKLIIRSFTPAVPRIFNLISNDRGRPLTDIVSHLAEAGDLRRDIQTVLETEQTVERNVRHTDGATHYLMRILPYRATNNVVEGVLVSFVDVTGLVDAEAHQRVLVEELNHRVRNMLTVVGTIASQTLARSPSPERFTESFMGRINSLAKSYSLVSNKRWGDVSLREIIDNELRAYRQESGRNVVLNGPDVAFDSSRALGLGLIFHELVTNAAKYGALSTSKGHLNVTWGLDGERLAIAWLESVGAPVTAPTRRGFGMELIERQLTTGFHGQANFEYGTAGLAVRLTLPHKAASP
nr:CheR family methyltransferase [Reyranella sp. CPCC 100927]